MSLTSNLIDSINKIVSPNKLYYDNLQEVDKNNKNYLSKLIDSFNSFISHNGSNKKLKRENILEDKKDFLNKSLNQVSNTLCETKESIQNKVNVSDIVQSSNELLSTHGEKILDIKNKSLCQVTNTLSETKESIQNKVDEYIKDLKKIIPVINKLGYTINEIEIELALIPKVIPHFHRHTEVKIEIQEKILDFCKKNNIPTLILSTIVEASKIQDKMNLGKLKFTDIEIELGVIPSVKIKFTQKG